MLSKEDYKARLLEISTLKGTVSLDKDPVAVGLASFNEKLALIQAVRERATSLFTEAIWNRAEAQSALDAADFDYSCKFNTYLGSDPEVQKLKSKEQREAYINVKLLTELTALQAAKKQHLFADSYLKNVQAIDSELDNKNDNLVHQINTVKAMMSIDPSMRKEFGR